MTINLPYELEIEFRCTVQPLCRGRNEKLSYCATEAIRMMQNKYLK